MMPTNALSSESQSLIEEARRFEPTAEFPFPAAKSGGDAANFAAVVAGTKPAALAFQTVGKLGTIADELLAEAERQGFAIERIPTALGFEFTIVGQPESVKELAGIYRTATEGKIPFLEPISLPHRRVGELLGYGEHANDIASTKKPEGTSNFVNPDRPQGFINSNSTLIP